MPNAATDLADAHTERTPLTGRKAIITGGTTGIGRAIAVLLASEGVEVFICGRDPQHLNDALERINQVGKGHGIACDLAEQEGIDRFYAEAQSTLGQYDIAILNAAIGAAGLADMSEGDVRTALAINFTANVMGAHHAIRQMRRNGGGQGDIIFTGSYATHKFGPGSSVYVATKCGIEGLVQALRREVAQQGIKVGIVTPALTGSDMQLPAIPPEQQRERIADESMLRAEDVAVAVHFMLTQPRRSVVQEVVVIQRNTDA